MAEQRASQAATAGTAGVEWMLWLSLLFMLSPVLHELIEHWIDSPWSRYSVSFIPLLLLASMADAARPPRPLVGLSLLGLAFAGQLLAVAGGWVALARPFAALAVLAMILFRGTTSPRAALLVFWVVPVPSFAIDILGAETTVRSFYTMAAMLLESMGMVFELGRRIVSCGPNELALARHQSGLLLAVHMTGLAWYSAQRRNLPWVHGSGRCLLGYAFLAIPIQFTAILTLLVLLYLDSPGWMPGAVETFAWLGPLLVVVWREERRRDPVSV